VYRIRGALSKRHEDMVRAVLGLRDELQPILYT